MTYLPNCSPSSRVSGRCFPLVSGNTNATRPEQIAQHPKTKNGIGLQISTSMNISGATIPPMLEQAVDMPCPADL